MEESVKMSEPTMFVEVEVKCKNCDHLDKVHVPVVCGVDKTSSDKTLYCDLEGDLKDYAPDCKECGKKDYEVEKEPVFIGEGGS
ncbi:TPA: hypothetical protein H1011_02975 [archaeon]|jgi:hypothetical protein|uniref:Uncharacterized protein n=1 Tax=Candidatus Undinarchaeum marinum TaxID=2756141 RepID=A0A832UQ63_9ARCH|nr:hypothetical protein [Candidatus Undinarchaeum marinum]